MKSLHPWLKIALCFIAISVAFYGYFYFRFRDLNPIYKTWDGPSYVIAAISLYDPQVAFANNFIQSTDIRADWTWLPAHFPALPLLIRLFSFMGYFQAIIFISLATSLLATIALYEFFKASKFTKSPLLLSLVFLLLTPRWFIVSHTGSSEPLFLFFMLSSMAAFANKQARSSAIWAALAMITRPQGALLGLGYGLVALIELVQTRKLQVVFQKYVAYLLIPLALLCVFTFYYFRTGDFWAFFSAISIFHHFQLSLFPTFNYPSPNVETFWQEINAVMFVLGLGSIWALLRSRLWWVAIITTCFYLPLIFMQHSDISRYMIPLVPMILLAYHDIFERKSFVVATFMMSPAIFLYAISFILNNHAQ